MACPITLKCYKALTKQFFLSQDRFLYEDLFDDWVELRVEIERDLPSEQALRLRGFYVVEFIYHHLATKWEGTEMGKARAIRLATTQYPRSSEGLSDLIESCEKEMRSLTADQGELQLLGDSGDEAAWKLLADQMDLPKFMLASCVKAAKLLRASLGGGTDGLGSLGHLFALDLIKASVTPDACKLYMVSLLRTNIHNPCSPVNRVDI